MPSTIAKTATGATAPVRRKSRAPASVAADATHASVCSCPRQATVSASAASSARAATPVAGARRLNRVVASHTSGTPMATLAAPWNCALSQFPGAARSAAISQTSA